MPYYLTCGEVAEGCARPRCRPLFPQAEKHHGHRAAPRQHRRGDEEAHASRRRLKLQQRMFTFLFNSFDFVIFLILIIFLSYFNTI